MKQRKSINFDIIKFLKNCALFLLNRIRGKKIDHKSNFVKNWKEKSDINLLRNYWIKENIDVQIDKFLTKINENNIENILEIGSAAGGVLRSIYYNCTDVKNLYGTEFNINFVKYGNSSAENENIRNLKIYNLDISSKEIIQKFRDKKIDCIFTNFTLSQLKDDENKILQLEDIIENLQPKFIYFGELFSFNNKIKFFKDMQNYFVPGRIFIDSKRFFKSYNNYNFEILKLDRNNFGIKYTQYFGKKIN